jgi:ankyrin repeat protein
MPTLKYLIEQGCADPNAPSGDGRRPLHVAVSKGGSGIRRACPFEPTTLCSDHSLLASSSSKFSKTETRLTPACSSPPSKGNAEIIQWLVELGGAHVNATNFAQETPLYHACYFKRGEAVDYLVGLASVAAALASSHPPAVVAPDALWRLPVARYS